MKVAVFCDSDTDVITIVPETDVVQFEAMVKHNQKGAILLDAEPSDVERWMTTQKLWDNMQFELGVLYDEATNNLRHL